MSRINCNFERFYFNNANCRLSYVDFGSPDKPDLILLHGMQDHAMSLVEIAQTLSAKYHVIALDLRGHGKSDNPGIYTMVHFIADVRTLVEHCKLENPVIVAHSLGGHIASRYSAIFSNEVAKLVLLDGMGPPSVDDSKDGELGKARLRHAILSVSKLSPEGRQMKDEEEALSRLTRNNPKLSNKLATVIVGHGLQQHSNGGVTWSFDTAVQMIWNTFSFDESEKIWSWIECPTLIVTGEHALEYWANMREYLRDKKDFYEQTLKRRAQIFNDARHKVIDDAGHMLHYDQPEKLNALLGEFLID